MLTAAENAHMKLLKYYCKTMPLYCITSVFDPRLNMHYFHREKWAKPLIKAWKSKMEDIWEKNYKPEPEPANNTMSPSPYNSDGDDFINSINEKKQRVDVDDELER